MLVDRKKRAREASVAGVAKHGQDAAERHLVPVHRTHYHLPSIHTEMCCGTEAGSYLRLIDSCITQLKAQGPSRTCNESKEEEVSTRWSTTLSSKVNLYHAINLRALRGENLVTQHPGIEGGRTLSCSNVRKGCSKLRTRTTLGLQRVFVPPQKRIFLVSSGP